MLEAHTQVPQSCRYYNPIGFEIVGNKILVPLFIVMMPIGPKVLRTFAINMHSDNNVKKLTVY